MSRDIQAEIAETVAKHPVVLYMKGNALMPLCGFSAATAAVLQELGVRFKHVDVLKDPDIREGIKVYSDWPTIPQLYVGGEFIGGCDIVRELHEKGELEPLIQKALDAAS